MAKTFVISDTHFNHAPILEFKDYIGKPVRDFDSVAQMNEAMMDNWVSVVGLNVHGHIHTNPSPDGPYKCVCVEQIDYTPLDIDTLIT